MNATATKTNDLTAKMMKALGCTKPESIAPRLNHLGLTVTCGRCGGSGNYSYCAMHGTTCFGCSGSGKKMPKITAKLVDEAAALVAAGKLEDYLLRQTRRASVNKVVAEIYDMLKPIGEAYSAEYDRVHRNGTAKNGEMNETIFNLQTRANQISHVNQKGKTVKGKRLDAEMAAFEIKLQFKHYHGLNAERQDVLLNRLDNLKEQAKALAEIFRQTYPA